VDGRWWVSRRDSRWLGPVGRRCSAGGLGIPLTLPRYWVHLAGVSGGVKCILDLLH